MNLLGERIETGRLVLRPLELADVPEIFRAFNREVTRYMAPAAPGHPDETARFVEHSRRLMERGAELCCTIREAKSGAFLGCAGLHHVGSRTPEFGIWLARTAQGRGYGTESIRALRDWGARLDPEGYVYPVDRRNMPSRRLAERLGGVVVETRSNEKATPDGRRLETIVYRVPTRS